MTLFTRPSTIWLKSFLNKSAAVLALSAGVFFSACSPAKDEPLIIWTDREEIVSCAELFNATHDIKAAVVYKSDAARSLPPARDEKKPDLVIASWLRTSSMRKNFSSIEKLFSQNELHKSDFYSILLNSGAHNGSQYLIPVSFNLPAVVFDEKSASFVKSSHIISVDEIRAADKAFSEVDEKGQYKHMGYAPSWDGDFLYLVAKLKGASFKEKDSIFGYDDTAVDSAVSYLRSWTLENHTETLAEQNFQFRYLYMPKNEQLEGGRSLFTYMTSRDFYTMPGDRADKLSFRWISDGEKIMIEDDVVYLGQYREAQNPSKSALFVKWFFSPETQKNLIERYRSMGLDTKEFGIAGGFSSLKEVNSKIFPTYYHELLGNMPNEDIVSIPDTLPARWQIFKSRVIIPFLKENTAAVKTEDSAGALPGKSLDEFISDWSRQAF